jgi:hypothetical protein
MNIKNIREKDMTTEQKFEIYSLSRYNYFADLRQGDKMLEGEFEKRYAGVFNQVLSQIPKREAKIFMLRNYEGKNLEEIGKKMHISRERVRQLELRASSHLRYRFPAVMMPIEEKYVRENEERLQSELIDNKYGPALRYIFSKVNRLEAILENINKKISTLEPNADYMLEKMKKEELLKNPIEALGLSSRPYNALKSYGITSIGNVMARTEADILAMKNLGMKSLQEVKYQLAQHGLSLKK